MATFLMLHGAASDGWYWHLVAPHLEAAGHRVVAPDLPVADPEAGIGEYADAAIAALGGEADDVVVVAQSLAGFVAPVVCDRIPVRAAVLVAAMVPLAGESANEWAVGDARTEACRALELAEGRDPDAEFDEEVQFLHDVPRDVVVQMEAHLQDQQFTPFDRYFEIPGWPDGVSLHAVIGRGDRFLPVDFERRVVRERMGIEADELDCGHLPALVRPAELADLLLGYL